MKDRKILLSKKGDIEMRKIFLPTLKKIEIINFSLYRTDITYEFIEGVNLIIGGNGVGKTTFVNLIKYGLLGLYKKGLDTKTYMEERRDKRTPFVKPNDYFKNRMSEDYEKRNDARVVLSFYINDTYFRVTRGLYDVGIFEVFVSENGQGYFLDGLVIRQDKYDRLEPDERRKYLQYNYEELVAERANFGSFDDMIFFVNDILYFDEDRETILWNTSIQGDLSSKYLNDLELDEEYQESKRKSKYHDSIARHKSEDIRAIKRITDSVDIDKESTKDIEVVKKISQIRKDIDRISKKLENLQKSRKLSEGKIKVLSGNKVNRGKELKDIEDKMGQIELRVYQDIWKRLNPDYQLFLENIKSLCMCPLCNNELDTNFQKTLISKDSNCILCNNQIKIIEEDNSELKDLKLFHEQKLRELRTIESELFNEENNLEHCDKDYNKIKRDLFEKQRNLRDLEHSIIENNEENKDNLESITYRTMLNELERLEEDKKENQELSKKYSEVSKSILRELEENLKNVTKDLSSIFTDFAEDFLGFESKLTYDDLYNEGVKRFIPFIKGKERMDPEELSESQRFFIDQAFRMSLLSFFYTTPAFFICETPDSSLDISYEANAAEIYLKYLNKPNSLIITSNLNNSEFLENIITGSNKINYINLLEYGKPSIIQVKNSKLNEISKEIEESIHDKQKKNT